jgi:hypothetical protein
VAAQAAFHHLTRLILSVPRDKWQHHASRLVSQGTVIAMKAESIRAVGIYLLVEPDEHNLGPQ